MKRKPDKFDFDVAISCAGEDRRPAERLAKLLRTKGLSVFYDLDYRSYLWGKKESEFQRIYGPASRFFVPIISAHYKEKEWCRFEFDIAREEARKRKEEFILPVRLDDSKILGLREDTIYHDLRQMSVSKIAQELKKKIEFGCQLPEAVSHGTRRQRVQILTQYSRKVLGIIAVYPFPVRIEHFEKIFPQIEWRKEIRFFRRAGLLEREPRSLRVNKSVERSLLSEPEEAKIFHQSWIQALKPLKKHTDIALILALQYIALKQFDEAVMVLANIAAGMEPDWWNDAYLTIFKIMNEKQLLRRLSTEPRLQFCNAMGLCFSRAGNYKEALKWFLKLRDYSKRFGSAWGLGQSYINCGVVYYHVGDTAKAERCYRKSAEHARQTNDKLLLGRSLHNLAMIIMGRDTDAAMQLIDESLSLKKSGGDQVGIARTYTAHGILAAQKRQLLQAIKWFKKAEKKARTFGLRHTLAFIIGNLGAAHVDLNRFKEAFVYYRKARKIAEEEKDQDGLTFIVQGEGLARARNGEFGKAEALFQELAALKKLSGDVEGVITALHDLGISLIKQRKGSKARQVLGQALGLARRTRNWEWIYRCHLSSALFYAEIGNVQEEIKTLKTAANKEQEAGLYPVAARLWEFSANRLIENNGPTDAIEKSFQMCKNCLIKSSTTDRHILSVYKQYFLWKWENGSFESAIKALEEIAKAATANKQPKERIHAIDQKGVCLQYLGRFAEAEKAHRQALKLARRFKDKECIVTSINNLGELFRKTGRTEQALNMFIEAESVARSRHDLRSEISISHNRALALEDIGKREESEKLLGTCRNMAKQHKLWDEYVRALHGLANLAWIQGKDRLAEYRYAKALTEANTRELSEMKCAISLNYSRLLRNKKRSTEAFQILTSLQDEFARFPDSYFYYMTLAQLYLDVNNMSSAKANWEKAKQAAGRTRDRDNVALCSAALAEIYRKEGKLALADKELEDAFHNEDDPEGQALILLQRIDVLLEANRVKQAKKIFEQARTITENHGLQEAYIDLHMKIGDYNWGRGFRSQFHAMQAYVVAMLRAVQVNMEIFVRTGLHISKRLYAIGAKSRIGRIDELSKRLSSWLRKQIEIIEDSTVIERILWPFRVARLLSSASQSGHKLSDQEIAEIVKSELTRSIDAG